MLSNKEFFFFNLVTRLLKLYKIKVRNVRNSNIEVQHFNDLLRYEMSLVVRKPAFLHMRKQSRRSAVR